MRLPHWLWAWIRRRRACRSGQCEGLWEARWASAIDPDVIGWVCLRCGQHFAFVPSCEPADTPSRIGFLRFAQTDEYVFMANSGPDEHGLVRILR